MEFKRPKRARRAEKALGKGKRFAYYEILDTIKNELKARGQDLQAFGLHINLEKKIL